jgi:hypothetical protein
VPAFAKEQPQDGDTILHCGHLGRSEDVTRSPYWFQYEAPIRFARPDETSGEAAWFMICEGCFLKHGHEAPVGGDIRWFGSDPVVYERENN